MAAFLLLLPFAISWRDGFSLGAVIGSGLILLSFYGVGWWVSQNMDFSEINEKWDKFTDGDNVSVNARMKLSEMTWEMFEDNPWIGWGAGSYYYQFPYYGMSYPEIYFTGKPGKRNYAKNRRNFKQAHNDHFQFLAEYGIVGCSILVLLLGYWVVAMCIWRGSVVELLMALAVAGVFLLHNFGDFFLQNSIILMSFLIILCCSVGLGQSKGRAA